MKKKIILLFSLLAVGTVVTACGTGTQAKKVSYNVSQDADNFNVIRRVAVINTRTDKVEFEVIGNISVDTSDKNKLVIIAETDKGVYKKHLVNMTEWNMYVVEDLDGAKVNKYKYEVNYMPESIIPWDIVRKD
ncbi:TPA: hypothetical protein JJJ54_001083 [Enterococcus faecalis]|uniref:beta-sandwich lipoprotein n=1 Tax=Enterococcus TaxID=1350 RepID=UPI0029845328|nr:hypothetical protein [Enterococcus faecalis]HAW7082165.1 hypothetical protein [Enterococcus faecalis]HAW7106633.1 hypothetical protein [Enterococcus faecalis]